MRQLQAIRPDLIVLSSTWNVPNRKETFDKLAATIVKLKATTGANVVIISPPPLWNHSPRYTAYSLRNGTTKYPAGLLPASIDYQLEADLRAVAGETGTTFISLPEKLCVADLCVFRVNDDPTGWIAVDDAHLSKAGSQYAVGLIFPELVGAIERGR